MYIILSKNLYLFLIDLSCFFDEIMTNLLHPCRNENWLKKNGAWLTDWMTTLPSYFNQNTNCIYKGYFTPTCLHWQVNFALSKLSLPVSIIHQHYPVSILFQNTQTRYACVKPMVAVTCWFLVVFMAVYGTDIFLSIKYSYGIISALTYCISYIHHIIIFKVFQKFLSFAMLIALFPS